MGVEVKAFEHVGFTELDGIVEGWPAVFGNVDLVGDVTEPGSFAKTIAEKGTSIPMGYDHEFGFGTTLQIHEGTRDDLPAEVRSKYPDASGGVYAKGQVMLTDENIVRLYRIRAAARAGRPPGLSFSFRPIIARKSATAAGRPVRRLVEVALHEWGVQVERRPINPAAVVTDVKSADLTAAPWAVEDALGELEVTHAAEVVARFVTEAKAGRMLSAANLRAVDAAIAALTELRKRALDGDGGRRTTDEDEEPAPKAKGLDRLRVAELELGLLDTRLQMMR